MIEFKGEIVVITDLIDGVEERREIPFLDPKEKKVEGWRYDPKRRRFVFIYQRRRIVGVVHEMIAEAISPLAVIETWEKELQRRGFLPKEV